MKPQDKLPDDERLRELFHELRREDERRAPAFRSLRWIRQELETRPTRVRRLAVAGSLAVVVTAALAALAVGPRWWGANRPEPEWSSTTSVTVRKYVPPPPRVERRTIKPPDSSFIVGDPEPSPPPPPASKARRLPASEQVQARRAATTPPVSTELEASLRTAERLASLGYVGEAKTTFGDEFIQDLPVKGRRHYTNVVILDPAAQDTDMDGKPNRHGARERDFATIVGGVSNVDPLTGLQLRSFDSIEEIEVITAGAGVEYGRAQGGFANVIETATVGTPPERMSTESYAAIEDNPFHVVADEPLSTFSADVDTASYSNVRRFLRSGQRPPRDAVRIEELINYFSYDAPAPRGKDPFGVAVEVADCPWNPDHRLARITLEARRATRGEYGGSNLVFLLDVSGSMGPANKLPLVKQALSMLADQLDGRDTVSIVVYAGASGLVLPPTPGSDRTAILESLSRLDAGGSTAGADGLRLAYRTARENFIEGGVNRVILATDGDFNVGVTSHSQLLRIIEKDAKRGVFLTALGFGMGNYQDDRLEQLADRGNGNYAYIDDLAEARKVLVEEIGGTLMAVAKDVKLQVEFNPKEVGAYRLIGYENRLLAHRDFNDDTKDAGEIGAGHTVTVLYEIVPPGEAGTQPEVDPLLYQGEIAPTEAAGNGELFTLKIRFKAPHGSKSELRTYPVRDDGLTLGSASDDFRFAAAVAAFGMRLRDADSVRDLGWGEVEGLAAGAGGVDEHGHRAGFMDLIRQAEKLPR
jgi:Ca-activated chloride channel family protein